MSFSPSVGQFWDCGHVRISPLVAVDGSGSVLARNSNFPYVWLRTFDMPPETRLPLIIRAVIVNMPSATVTALDARIPFPALPLIHGPYTFHLVESTADPLKSSDWTSCQPVPVDVELVPTTNDSV